MSPPRPVAELSPDEARRMSLSAQLLMGAPDRRAGVFGMLRALGAVQLDTISVLARSHELVAYARRGPVGRADVEAAYWSGEAFEYWGHAASIMPLSHWPLFAAKRRWWLNHALEKHPHVASVTAGILQRITAEGPMTVSMLGGARKTGDWWDWSDTKHAAEQLLASGRLVCARRTGWRRIYDLPERVVPLELLHDDLDDDECRLGLLRIAGRALGVATASDLVDFFRLKKNDVVRLLPGTGLAPVSVEGWPPAWADPDALAGGLPRGRHRTTLLSPFDSLVWDRKRTARVFGLDHRLEAYVPKELRQHGYFSMPVLAGGRLIARVDPARVNGTLVAKHVTVVPAEARASRLPATATAVTKALAVAASWVGCTGLAIERVTPATATQSVQSALAAERAAARS